MGHHALQAIARNQEPSTIALASERVGRAERVDDEGETAAGLEPERRGGGLTLLRQLVG